MFYTIYKITNQLDGKIYIGSHKTKRLDDKITNERMTRRSHISWGR